MTQIVNTCDACRIVAKLDQLISLCDNLESRLSRSQADGERLMEAVVWMMLVVQEVQSIERNIRNY